MPLDSRPNEVRYGPTDQRHNGVATAGASWIWAHASGGPIIVAGLPAGPHKIEITPVDANHRPVAPSQVVEFVIPTGMGHEMSRSK